MFQVLVRSAIVRSHPMAVRRLGLAMIVIGTFSCVVAGWLVGPLLIGHALSSNAALVAVVNWIAGPLEAAGGGLLYHAGRTTSKVPS